MVIGRWGSSVIWKQRMTVVARGQWGSVPAVRRQDPPWCLLHVPMPCAWNYAVGSIQSMSISCIHLLFSDDKASVHKCKAWSMLKLFPSVWCEQMSWRCVCTSLTCTFAKRKVAVAQISLPDDPVHWGPWPWLLLLLVGEDLALVWVGQITQNISQTFVLGKGQNMVCQLIFKHISQQKN